MPRLRQLIENNKKWSDETVQQDPEFFERLAAQQSPQYLWIGCSDSRVPANQVTGLAPGEVFVHRNIANVVTNTDFNCLSVVQYAVEVLKVRDIIVCGHYGCGGIMAALSDSRFGLIDNWLRNIKDIASKHTEELQAIDDPVARINKMCELNVTHQVAHLCYTTIVQGAWASGQPLTVHGVIYGLSDGKLKDLNISVDAVSKLPDLYRMAY